MVKAAARAYIGGMVTRLYTHPIFLEHLTPPGHPERPDRLRAIERVLDDEAFAALDRAEAPEGDEATILYAHPQEFVERIRAMVPETRVSLASTPTPPSARKAGRRRSRRSALPTPPSTMSFRRSADNVFVAARPPGHHAEKTTAMGFCLFNNAAIAARYAQKAASGRARRDRRLGRPPRQRHAGHLLGRSVGALLLDAPDAALSRHRRDERDRRRQHRQRAAVAADRQRAFSARRSCRASCRRSTISRRT